MSRATLPILLVLSACPQDSVGDPAPLEVVVMASCSDDRCDERILEAVTLAGEPTSWSWVLPDGSTAKGQMVATRGVDGLDMYEVLATADDGGAHRAFSAIVTFDMTLAAVGTYDEGYVPNVVIVPMSASCDQIPIINIGGCFSDPLADPLGLIIYANNPAPDVIGFSTSTAIAGTSNPYSSTQATQRALWRLGTTEGMAAGSTPTDYVGLLAPPFPTDHFTAYFQGVLNGTSTVLVSHGPSTDKLYGAEELLIKCDKKGNITQLRRRSTDRKALDFDGDGYPESEDCDETDPQVNAGSGC